MGRQQELDQVIDQMRGDRKDDAVRARCAGAGHVSLFAAASMNVGPKKNSRRS
jgi:hypothetical protein